MTMENLAVGALMEMAEFQEREMYAALRAVEDRLWSLDEVKRRCNMVRRVDAPIGEETFYVDGKPMIEFRAMESVADFAKDTVVFKYTRPFRRLYK